MTSAVIPQPVKRPANIVLQYVVYLATYAGRGFYGPFITLYLLSVGFSPLEIGILTGFSALIRLVVVPAYSAFIDRRGAHRKLLGAQILTTGLTTLGLVLFPGKLWISAMYTGRDAVDVPGAALLAQLSITGHRERGASMYGKLRAMGSLGWGIATLVSGPLIHLGGYTLLIILSAVVNIAMLPFIKVFPERTASSNSRLDKPPKRLPVFWLIMASNLLFYAGMNAMILFLFVYSREYLGADDTTIGIIAAGLGIAEIPWMVGMGRIYRRMSTRTALMIGMAGQGLFVLSLALLTDTTLLFPLIVLRGFFYALQNISLTLIVTEISHPANVATNQAITWVTIPALAAILTGPLMGWMYEQSDARLMWALAALLVIMGALLLVVGRTMIDRARAARLSLHVN